jgi:hypothetical protein
VQNQLIYLKQAKFFDYLVSSCLNLLKYWWLKDPKIPRG